MADLPIYLGRVTYIIDLDYFYMHIGTGKYVMIYQSLPVFYIYLSQYT